jgi:hypothetical protein
MIKEFKLLISGQTIRYQIEDQIKNGNSIRIKIMYPYGLSTNGIEFQEKKNLACYVWSDEIINIFNSTSKWNYDLITFDVEKQEIVNCDDYIVGGGPPFEFQFFGRYETKGGKTTFITYVPYGLTIFNSESDTFRSMDKIVLIENEKYTIVYHNNSMQKIVEFKF